MKKIIDFFAIFCACFYSPYLAKKWHVIRDTIYTCQAIKKFASVGLNPIIMCKIRVLGGENITIGNNFYCYWGQRFETYSCHNGQTFSPQLIIGDNVSINPDCHIGVIHRVELHDGVLLASRVFITDHFHGNTSIESLRIPPQKRILTTKGAVIIKRNAWIGEGVAIMPGVTIGENAIIGANSVVTKNIPNNAVAAGIPARVIKQL